MFGSQLVNPDESIFASIAWTLWTEGRLGTDLLAGAIPGIEHVVYWTPPLYYVVLAGWLGLWGFSLLSARLLSTLLAVIVIGLLWQHGRVAGQRAAWVAGIVVLFSPCFAAAAAVARMDMLAIALSTAALVVVDRSPLTPRRAAAAGLLAAAALLTHPLGGAAGLAVGVTAAVRQRRALLPMAAGALPLLLLWGLYILGDPGTFGIQVGLQLARKAAHTFTAGDNLTRFLGAFGPLWHGALLLWLGGTLGLILSARRRLPWLVAGACLWPALLLSGETSYPAYVAPLHAVGVAALLTRVAWAPRLALLALAVRLAVVAADPPPLGGIHPDYYAYCSAIGSLASPGDRLLLAVLPDATFGLLDREDLDVRLAPPVPLDPDRLHAYVAAADVTVLGHYNPPGFAAVLRNWDAIATRGQKLWILEGTQLLDFADIRDEMVIEDF